MSNIFYIGAEGGATKSSALLTNSSGKILAEHSGGALNYHALEIGEVKNNLKRLIRPLILKAGNGTIRAVFGLAGLDTKRDEVEYESIVKSALPAGSVFKVVNDANIAIEAMCPGEQKRILVISGTGASVYGENGRKSAKAVGWGHILGDDGSAYYSGLEVLKYATRSWDGRIKKTALETLVRKSVGAKTMDEFVAKVYQKMEKGGGLKSFIASFSPLLDDAILNKDWAALRIRNDGADALAVGVAAVARRLGFSKRTEFIMAIAGSQWKMPGFSEIFKKQIFKKYPKIRFCKNSDSGAWGAVLLAKKLR